MFAAMPERYRLNAHTKKIDSAIDDRDYSIGCFEGIRSEELEGFLERYLVPDVVYERNAFLWRLVDATYSDNFRLSEEADVTLVKQMVASEFVHWATGGRATELHGVYRKKTL